MESEEVQQAIERQMPRIIAETVSRVKESLSKTLLDNLMQLTDQNESKINAQINEIRANLGALENQSLEIQFLTKEIGLCKTLCERKVDVNTLDSVYAKMSDYMTKDQGRNIFEQLSQRARETWVQQFMNKTNEWQVATDSQMQQQEDEIKKLQETFNAEFTLWGDEFEKIKNQSLNITDELSTFEKIQRKDSIRVNQVLKDLKKELGECVVVLDAKFENLSKYYTTIIDFNNLNIKTAQQFESQKKSFETEVFPLVQKCNYKIQQFTKDNEDVKEAILSFDRVMTTKADRWNLVEVKQWVEQEFISVKQNESSTKRAEQFQADAKNLVIGIQSDIKRFETNLKEAVQLIVEEDIQQRMKRYELVVQEFQKFFNQDFLSKILDRKVDFQHLEKIMDNIVNKEQYNNLLQGIELIDTKVRHLATIQVEMSKSMIPTQTNSINIHLQEAAQSKLVKQEMLLRDAQLTQKWINDVRVDGGGQSRLKTSTVSFPNESIQSNLFQMTRESSPSNNLEEVTPYFSKRIANKLTSQAIDRNKSRAKSQSLELRENISKYSSKSTEHLQLTKFKTKDPHNVYTAQSFDNESNKDKRFKRNKNKFNLIQQPTPEQNDPYQDHMDFGTPLVILSMKANYNGNDQHTLSVMSKSAGSFGEQLLKNPLQQTKYIVNHQSARQSQKLNNSDY